jgi:hypothetical protein
MGESWATAVVFLDTEKAFIQHGTLAYYIDYRN